jgi:hypothetical protein
MRSLFLMQLPARATSYPFSTLCYKGGYTIMNCFAIGIDSQKKLAA